MKGEGQQEANRSDTNELRGWGSGDALEDGADINAHISAFGGMRGLTLPIRVTQRMASG